MATLEIRISLLCEWLGFTVHASRIRNIYWMAFLLFDRVSWKNFVENLIIYWSFLYSTETRNLSFNPVGLNMEVFTVRLMFISIRFIWLTWFRVTHESLIMISLAVFPATYWTGIVAVSYANSESSSTGRAARWKPAPLTPAAVHCNQTDNFPFIII